MQNLKRESIVICIFYKKIFQHKNVKNFLKDEKHRHNLKKRKKIFTKCNILQNIQQGKRANFLLIFSEKSRFLLLITSLFVNQTRRFTILCIRKSKVSSFKCVCARTYRIIDKSTSFLSKSKNVDKNVEVISRRNFLLNAYQKTSYFMELKGIS